MAEKSDEELNSDQRIRRSAARSFVNALVSLTAIAVIGAWLASGFYYIAPGEAAVST